MWRKDMKRGSCNIFSDYEMGEFIIYVTKSSPINDIRYMQSLLLLDRGIPRIVIPLDSFHIIDQSQLDQHNSFESANSTYLINPVNECFALAMSYSPTPLR